MNGQLRIAFLFSAIDVERVLFVAGLVVLWVIGAIAAFTLFFYANAWLRRRNSDKLRRYISNLEEWRIEPDGKSLNDLPFCASLLSEAIESYKPSPIAFCRKDNNPRWLFCYQGHNLGHLLSFSNSMVFVSENYRFTGLSMRLRHDGINIEHKKQRYLHNFRRVDSLLRDWNANGWYALDTEAIDTELLVKLLEFLRTTQSIGEIILKEAYLCCVGIYGEFSKAKLDAFLDACRQIEEITMCHAADLPV